jgi:hypothetical protein
MQEEHRRRVLGVIDQGGGNLTQRVREGPFVVADITADGPDQILFVLIFDR